MATRPTSIVRTSNFLGLNDDLPLEIGDEQASTLTNFYKQRKKLVRRNGQALVGEASLSNLAADMVAPGTSTTTNFLRIASGANDLFAGQDMAGSAWVLFDSIATNTTVAVGSEGLSVMNIYNLGQAGGRSWRLSLNLTSKQLEFVAAAAGGTTTVTATSVTCVVDTWYHVAFRHDSVADTIAIRVNGGTLHSTAHTHGIRDFGASSTDFRAGTMYNGSATAGQQCMDGALGPCGVWRGAAGGGAALSDANLLALYNGGIAMRYSQLSAALLADLTAWWDMTEENGTRDDDNDAGATFNLLQVGTVSSRTGP